MNKIVVEQRNLHLNEESVFISSVPDEFTLYSSGDVCVALYTMHFTHLEIYLERNSHLLVEFLGVMENQKSKISIHSQENTIVDFHYACTYKQKNELVIESIVSSNARNYIKIRAVEDGGSLFIKAVGTILEQMKDIFYLEEIKAIVKNNNSITICPDLLVHSHEVVANHNASIGTVSDNELFYLKSLGISEKQAISLIKEGFLKGILQIEELKK